MRIWRHYRGWTIRELASRSNLKRSALDKVELSKTLQPRLLCRISKALGVSESWLAFGVLDSDEEKEVALAANSIPSFERKVLLTQIHKLIEDQERRKRIEGAKHLKSV